MSIITQVLNWISASLLLPDIILLLAAFACSLVSLGEFFTSCFMLHTERRRQKALLARLRAGEAPSFDAAGGVLSGRLAELATLGWDELECEKRIAEWQAAYDRELERHRFLVKVGPMLGLVGTLIPMGPALAGLASGDIANMAYNMQIAFATTVVGCVVAGIGILITSVKRHHYAEEVANLRYVLDRHLKEAVK